MKPQHSISGSFIPDRFTRWLLLTLALLALTWASAGAWAQAEDQTAGGVYISLGESLVVNYGGQGRLKYLRADISLRAANSRDAGIVRHHLPLIRGNLVLLFRSEEHTSELQSRGHIVCRLLLEKKKRETTDS